MPNDRYTPPTPPGYVFLTNSVMWKKDATGELVRNTCESVNRDVAEWFKAAPPDDFLTLVFEPAGDPGRPHIGYMGFATFLPESYADRIKRLNDALHGLIESIARDDSYEEHRD